MFLKSNQITDKCSICSGTAFATFALKLKPQIGTHLKLILGFATIGFKVALDY